MSEHPTPPATPIQWPNYGQKAVLLEGKALYRKMPHGTSIDSLAKIAKCHANTFRTALDGNRVQYVKAHGVFTALNKVARGAFSRFDHVHYIEDGEEDGIADPILKQCAVLWQASSLLKKSGMKVEGVAKAAGINFLDASVVLESGKPAPYGVVKSVFDALSVNLPDLVEVDEIIG